jgi:hypothetical protein
MDKLKTAFEVLLLAIIAAFLVAMCLVFFVDLFWTAGDKLSDAFHAAFWGAFLAFIFVRIAQALDRFYDAGRSSRRALGRIQFALNEAMSINNDNQFVIDQWGAFHEKLNRAVGAGTILLFGNRLVPVPGTKEFLIDLTSIGLVNELFQLESSIRKLNDSMETWQRMYVDAKEAFVSKHVDATTYVGNVNNADPNAKALRLFMDDLAVEILHALTATRLALKPKPFLAKLFNWLNPDTYQDRAHPKRQQELAKLRGEAREISRESQKRIEAITGASPTVGKTP